MDPAIVEAQRAAWLARQAPPAATLAWLVAELEASAVVEVSPMQGASTAAMHQVTLTDRSGHHRVVVLRRYVRPEILTQSPDVAAVEARAMQLAERVPAPTPTLLALDATGDRTDVPARSHLRPVGRPGQHRRHPRQHPRAPRAQHRDVVNRSSPHERGQRSQLMLPALADPLHIGHSERVGPCDHWVMADDLQTLVGALAELPVASFVEVLHRTFDARRADIELHYFERKYALAVCSLLLSSDGTATTDDVQIEFVGRLLEPPLFDSLSESGGCASCGKEALSTNKVASCAICGAQVGLT